jgi:hypothetical protein
MLNKYSNKTVSHILKNKIYNVKNNNRLNKIIDTQINNLQKLYNKNIDFSKIYKTNINKINSPQSLPLLLKTIKKLLKNNNLDSSIKLGEKDTQPLIDNLQDIIDRKDTTDFFEWYNSNIDKLNMINCLLSKRRNQFPNELKKILKSSNNERKQLNKLLYDNPFISIDIHYFAETNDLIYYNFNDGNLNLHIYSIEHITNDFIKDLIMICYLMESISNKKLNGIDVRILLSPNKKKFNFNNVKVLCCQNINSGSTLQHEFINLWRKEEIHKVLIHELIHCLGIDDFLHYTNKTNDFVNSLSNKYNVKGKIIPFEAYTDSVAIIIHTIFAGFKFMFNKNDIIDLLSTEISFVLFQAAKILHYFNFNNIDELNSNSNSNKFIEQGTSVFSYFIIKSSLLFSLDTFLKFSDTNFKFKNRIDDFDSLINYCMNNKEFKKSIDYYINYIKNNKNNKYVYYNLRMSSIQIL